MVRLPQWTPTTPKREVRYIFRCPRRGCNAIWTRTYQAWTEQNTFGRVWERVERYDPETGEVLYPFSYADIRCPVCGHSGQRGREITAEVADDVPCNERCRTAVGPECRCACGGANHAVAWDQEREIRRKG